MKTKSNIFQEDLKSYHLFLMDLKQEVGANDLPQHLIKLTISKNFWEVKDLLEGILAFQLLFTLLG